MAHGKIDFTLVASSVASIYSCIHKLCKFLVLHFGLQATFQNYLSILNSGCLGLFSIGIWGDSEKFEKLDV